MLDAIPKKKDVDSLSARSNYSAPVVEAVREILKRKDISLEDKNILVIGQGRLVGKPISGWLAKEELKFQVADIDTGNISELTKKADVIISGAGSAHLIKPEMIKDDVVLIDAGTSEMSGSVVGDAHPECAEKSKVFTPVPGGVGPITVAMLFKNLLSKN